MTVLSFPQLPGQAWSVTKTAIAGSTRRLEASSGREVVASLWRYPKYEFEVVYDGLASNAAHPGLFANSLQMLMGFYLQCGGQFTPFIYQDPTDTYVQGAALGLGDGVKTSFTAQRALGGFVEPVGYVLNIGAVYVNSVAVSNWSLTTPNSVVFTTAPAAGAVITADFWFGYYCRFSSDQADFENFMSHLWQVKSLKFKTIRSS